MILRSKRHRTVLGFLLGAFTSIVVLGLAFYYYLSSVHIISESEMVEIQKNAVQEYIQNNPTSLIYVFARDMKAEEVLRDSDLVPAEIRSSFLPSDAVTNISDAVGKVVRCDITANTPVTFSLIYDEGSYPDDMRLTEYSVINLPEKLEPRQYVDIRIMFPNGLNYIVLSKKQVIDLKGDEGGKLGTIWFQSSEDEILRMSSAIVDASVVEGAYLYAVPYVAPDIQKEAQKTYPINGEVQDLILKNPNIVNKAITELEMRNRKLFEDLINKDFQNSGKSKVFGSDTVPVSQMDYNSSEAQDANTDYGMGERL